MVMGSACFTGHRVIPQTAELEERLYSVLERWICTKNITDFYAGGAIGWDSFASAVVLKLREVYPQVRLHLVLPCSSEEQSARWTASQRREYYRILELADSVEYICRSYFNGCMKERNIRLVELADTCCFCFWDPSVFTSGTGQTVRLARKKGLMIVNFRDNF